MRQLILTSVTARALDERLREKYGISTLVLMENAGRAVAEEARRMVGSSKNITIFCGKGNNGGDGLVAARHLASQGIKPQVFLAGTIKDVENEAKINLGILLKLKQKIIEVDEKNLRLTEKIASKSDLIIDALLGVGLKGKVREVYKELIQLINASAAKVLSVDIPSGLDATTGRTLGVCVKSDRTVTFMAKKKGMAVGSGKDYCGRIIIADLGICLFRINP